MLYWWGRGAGACWGCSSHPTQRCAHPTSPSWPQPKMSYKDGVQKSYLVLESFEDAVAKIEALSSSMPKAA